MLSPRRTQGWNFERRRDACTQFLIGVFLLTKGLPERDTSLEAVRTRIRLSPEEALFAARRLSDEKLIGFQPAGTVRSSTRGIDRAVPSPATNRAVGEERTGMPHALSEPRDAGEARDQRRRGLVRDRPLAELAEVVVPPAAYGAIGEERAGVAGLRRESDDVGEGIDSRG